MSFRIEEWQVMQAHKNGARIASTSRVHPNWVYTEKPKWNWKDNDYRIDDLTADGMRLDELVEKFQDELPVLCHSGNYITVDTTEFIKEMCETPSKIAKVKVKQKKELRPWTMEEFKKHREEWFVSLAGKNHKALFYDHRCILLAKYHEPELTYIEFMERFTREDGSPCGVLE